jgi:hypothetical protein
MLNLVMLEVIVSNVIIPSVIMVKVLSLFISRVKKDIFVFLSSPKYRLNDSLYYNENFCKFFVGYELGKTESLL